MEVTEAACPQTKRVDTAFLKVGEVLPEVQGMFVFGRAKDWLEGASLSVCSLGRGAIWR